MSEKTSYYRQYVPEIKLSIERGTTGATSDGKFHVIKEGKNIGSFSSLKQAQDVFKRLLAESGYRPKLQSNKQVTPADEGLERYLTAKDIFWAEGPKYREKGGPGR
jgi:hypothetical protein